MLTLIKDVQYLNFIDQNENESEVKCGLSSVWAHRNYLQIPFQNRHHMMGRFSTFHICDGLCTESVDVE